MAMASSRRGVCQAWKRATEAAQQKGTWAGASPLLQAAKGEFSLKGSGSGGIRNVGHSFSSLWVLSHRRADAMMVMRGVHCGATFASAAVVRSGQLARLAGRGSDRCPPAVLVRKLHSVEAGNKLGSSASQALKGQTGAALVVPRRGLAVETWTERWNKTTERFKNAINLKPKGSAGVKATGAKVAGVQGRPREILTEVSKPVQRTISFYREAVGLQLEAFWKRNYLFVVGAVGLGVCLLLWRLMFGIASTFISMSEGLAKFGFLALAAAMVIVSGVVVRARFTINPDAVYRVAMRKLNTSAAVLEIMGAPLSGTDLRAYIMSGGGLRMKNFKPRLAGKRCFIIFPIRGSERRGLVSIEVKKKKGQYDFKLLAVDVPTAGTDERLYLIGDEREYKVGGSLIAELRDPIVKAMAAQKEFEELDMREEEEEEEEKERQVMEAETKRVEELDRLEKKRAQEELESMEEQEAKEKEKPSPVPA